MPLLYSTPGPGPRTDVPPVVDEVALGQDDVLVQVAGLVAGGLVRRAGHREHAHAGVDVAPQRLVVRCDQRGDVVVDAVLVGVLRVVRAALGLEVLFLFKRGVQGQGWDVVRMRVRAALDPEALWEEGRLGAGLRCDEVSKVQVVG